MAGVTDVQDSVKTSTGDVVDFTSWAIALNIPSAAAARRTVCLFQNDAPC